MPKVSVVVPVYNVEEYLEKCVNSILKQTWRDFELLLVDDGSTDTSGALCDKLGEKDPRIQVIHQENKGLGGARNTGLEAASGEWLLFVDSDDWIEPHTLEKSLKAGEETGAKLVMFAFRSVDETGRTVQEFKEDLPWGEVIRVSQHKEVFLTSPCAWNKLYRAELFRDTGVRYPPRVWYEDIRTTLKLLPQAEEVVCLGDVCYNYLLRAGSITKNMNAGRNVEILEAFDDILAYFGKKGMLEEYRDELCYLTMFHAYLTASVRVLNIDPHHGLLPKFADYCKEHFPDYRKNKYLPRLGKKRKLLLSLLDRKQYALIAWMFRVKG